MRFAKTDRSSQGKIRLGWGTSERAAGKDGHDTGESN